MSFFDSLEDARSLPEDKKFGVALAAALFGTGLIFSGWLFFVFGQPAARVPEPLAATTAHHENENGPSPAELLIAGFKASHDNLLEHTTGLRDMLGDGFASLGVGGDQAPSSVESGTLSPSSATQEHIDQSASLQGNIVGSNLSDAEKEAILDAYFNNAKAARDGATRTDTGSMSGNTSHVDPYPTTP